MLKLGIAVVIALLGLVGLLSFLLAGAPPADPGAEAGPNADTGLRFDDLIAFGVEPAGLEPYPTRDGGTRFLRRYPAPVPRTLVLIHGSGYHSAYLASWKKPLLVLVGAEDEAFLPREFAGVVRPHAPHATVELLPGADHLGVAVDHQAVARIQVFVDEL